jgi:hypothetical protein
MENEKLVRVMFYKIDCFSNTNFVRKSHIGYLREADYKLAVQNNRPVFEVMEDDPFGHRLPETMTI